MNQHEIKKRRIEYLLARMSKEPMNCHQMADAINVSIKTFSKYLTELRFKKLVHIARYERNTIGAYTVYYMTGNFPDAIKPVPLSQKEYNDRYKTKAGDYAKKRKIKFTPRPDYAAAWLFNPIQND